MKVNRIEWLFSLTFNILKITISNDVIITPVINPLIVFPELIEGISFVPPIIFPPKNENVSNIQITIIIEIISKLDNEFDIMRNINKKNEEVEISINILKYIRIFPLFFIELISSNIIALIIR
tara:strand:- start:2115 stop:2483 length:369 start_codon:yes stop_codon:yes gene_type:complete